MSSQPFDPSVFGQALSGMASVSMLPPITPERWGYREAAAVRSTFAYAGELAPVAVDPNPAAARELLFGDCRRVEGPDGSARWMLDEDVRRKALLRLKTPEAIHAAIAGNRAEHDTLQQLLEKIAAGDPIALRELSFEELAQVRQISSWLRDVVPEVPDESEVEEYLAVAELLAPIHALTADGFFGREDVLGDISQHVFASRSPLANLKPSNLGRNLAIGLSDLWFALRDTSRPPLHLHGAGGTGKSSVLARFVLEQVDVPEPRLVFVNLDFNRPKLQAHEPLTLLAEMLRQLSAQLPELHETSEELRQNISQRLVRREFEPGATALQDQRTVVRLSEREEFVRRLAELLDDLPGNRRPILLLLDTLEEVQYRGQDFLEELWYFLGQLNAQIQRLRIITAGRARLEGVEARQLPLDELDEQSARQLLAARLAPLGGEAVELAPSITKWVGRNPLTLRLAADVALDSGLDELRSLVRSPGKRAKPSEIIQGLLYRRILDHLHDEGARKLALPGLALRRVTPAVIQHVLAEPSGLGAIDEDEAHDLFDRFEKEVSLVDTARDGSLRYRNDIRRLALRLVDADPTVPTREVNHRAVVFYNEQVSEVARAEELYHRLRLGQDRAQLDACWRPGVQDRLAGALDDLSGASFGYLATKLGLILSSEQLADADASDWEIQAEKRARYFIDLNDGHRALEILRERRPRSAASRLPLLEASALDLVGKTKDASRLLDQALESDAPSGGLAMRVELALAAARARHALVEPRAARARLQTAGEAALQSQDPVLQLKFVATCRELRLPVHPDVDVDAVLARMEPSALREEPATLCAAAAHLGQEWPQLIDLALDAVGLPGLRRDERTRLAAVLAQSTGRSAEAWGRQLERVGRTPAGAARLLRGVPLDPQLCEALALVYARLAPRSGQLSGAADDDVRAGHVPTWSRQGPYRRY